MLPPRKVMTDRARRLRSEGTELERAIWSRLRDRQLAGTKWHRQYPIGPYIADFYCHAAKLVVEVDGLSHHGKIGYDHARDAYMNSLGFRVLRMQSHEVAKDFDGHLQMILDLVSISPDD